MSGPAYVFISYRHEEPSSSLAHTFADALKSSGHEVFIDTGLRWGVDWVQEIRNAIERSDYFLVLLSPEAAVSEMVAEEISIAKELAYQRNGSPVILPIRVCFPHSEPLPYHISAYLRTIQQESWNSPEDTDRVIRTLLAAVGEPASWTAQTSSETPAASAPRSKPLPQCDPRDLITPGGALETESPFYVARQTDDEVLEAVRRSRAMVTIRGPRQTGKTSLIMRTYATLRREKTQCRVAFIDFQSLPYEDFQSLSTIWRAIAIAVADQLWLDDWDESMWKLEGSHDRNFSRFLDRFVFADEDVPLLICLDEVDRVFNSPLKAEFFPTVRAFYNRGAMDPSWKKVGWLLGTSSEPSFFIEDLTQSPFNVGLRVELNAFTPDEVTVFAERHGMALESNMLTQIMDYVGGRPYLVHLLLYHLVRHPESRDQLFDAPTAGGGVFRDNLHRYLMQFQQEQTLASAMKDVVTGNGCKDVRLLERLEAGGLVRHDEARKVIPLCRLYAEFFKKELP